MVERVERVVTQVVADAPCAWCGGPLRSRRRGPRPTYCCASCRQRAYEQRRAERATGRELGAAAVSGPPRERVLERATERPYPTTSQGWQHALDALAEQLRDGRLPAHTAPLAGRLREVLALLDDSPRRPARPAAPAPPVEPDAAALEALDARLGRGQVLLTLDQLADRIGAAGAAQAAELVAVVVNQGVVRAWRTGPAGEVDLTGEQLAALPPHARFRAAVRRD